LIRDHAPGQLMAIIKNELMWWVY